MKKLMIAFAIVAVAAVSQAANVVWGSGVIAADSQGTTITAADKIKAYVYELNATDFDTYSKMDGATLSKTIAGLFGTDKMPGTLDKSGNNIYNPRAGGASADITGATAHVAETGSATAYGLIVYEDLANDGWYMANVATVTVKGSADPKVAQLASVLGGADASRGATAWAKAGGGDAPEPTSGLLLLLGVAGLALRRHRA